MPPQVNRELCDGCGQCIYVCGRFVFEFDIQHMTSKVVRGADCVDCFMCEWLCPQAAVRIHLNRRPRRRRHRLVLPNNAEDPR